MSRTSLWLARLVAQREIVGLIPTRGRLLLFYFLNFSGTFLAFSMKVPGFPSNISEHFRKVTDEFWEHYCENWAQ